MTSFCPQPNCPQPINEPTANFCMGCGAELILGDRYRCLRLIGRGGFGRTFLAQDEYLDRQPRCVIKQFYPQDRSVRGQAMELFQQESLRLAQLGGHPQIPSLYKQFGQQEYEYIAQEFIDGDNLAQELAAQGRNFSELEIRSLLTDLLPVMTFIHRAEVIHRDIKPENIIRRRSDNKLCLVDFGAAKYATATALAKTGTTIGSAEYVAPEQARGKAMFASDIYSLGVTCLYLLTSVSPFDLFDTVNGEWIWRQYLDRHPVSDELGRILDRTVRNLPKDRYQTASEVQTDLTKPILVAATNIAPAKKAVERPSSVRPAASITPLKSTKSTQVKNYPPIETVNYYEAHENYQHAPSDGRPRLDGNANYHSLRGGAWSSPPHACRSASRCSMSAFYSDRSIGFRVALS